MKNITSFINEAEKSKGQKEYQAFFDKKLKEFGVDSPSKLSDEEKKKFFNEIDDEWTVEKVNEKKVEDDFDSEDDVDSEKLKDKKRDKDSKSDKKGDKGEDIEKKGDDDDEKGYDDEKGDDKDKKDKQGDNKKSDNVDESLLEYMKLNELSKADKKMLKSGESGDVANIRNGINNLFGDLSDNGYENKDITRVIYEIVDTSLQQIQSMY